MEQLTSIGRLGTLAVIVAAGIGAANGRPAGRPYGGAEREPVLAYVAADAYAAFDRDTARPRAAAGAETTEAGAAVTATAAGRSTLPVGTEIPGFLSPWGLPPVQGALVVTNTGLVFRSTGGATTRTFPLAKPVRGDAGRAWRASAVSLVYVVEDAARPVYLFRVDGGVFQTIQPGPLLEVAEHPVWLDSLGTTEWEFPRPLVNPADTAAQWTAAREIAAGGYADTLYALFGRPEMPVGLVGPRGRKAGRLGEYIASRDSLALDPARMTSDAQLRHALAHELAHRWQARAPKQIALLWQDVPPIRDTKRYGHHSTMEHQAEAIAFAVHFLQTTAAADAAPDRALALLDHYELLVPGTRLMTRYFALQPVYRSHPLRLALTAGLSS